MPCITEGKADIGHLQRPGKEEVKRQQATHHTRLKQSICAIKMVDVKNLHLKRPKETQEVCLQYLGGCRPHETARSWGESKESGQKSKRSGSHN